VVQKLELQVRRLQQTSTDKIQHNPNRIFKWCEISNCWKFLKRNCPKFKFKKNKISKIRKKIKITGIATFP
jgi:hypothetical protein